MNKTQEIFVGEPAAAARDAIDADELAREIGGVDCSELVVRDDYLDRNGHLNAGYYAVLFDQAATTYFGRLGMGWAKIPETGISQFALTSRLIHYREVLREQPLAFAFRLLDVDARRVHFFITMSHAREGWPVAASEGVNICVNMTTRRATFWPPEFRARLQALLSVHRQKPAPPDAGKPITMQRTNARGNDREV